MEINRSDALHSSHRQLVQSAQTILDRASNENRDLTPLERVEFERLEADIAMTTADLEAHAERQRMVDRAARALPEDYGQTGAAGFNVNVREDPLDLNLRDMQRLDATQARGRALTFLERAPERNFLGGHDHAEDVAGLIERDDGELGVGATAARLSLATGSTDYARAWKRYMTVGQSGLRENERGILDRAMTVGTGSSGGYFVPVFLDPTMIITGAGTSNAIRSRADVRQISGLTFNGVTAGQITASEVGEGSAFSDNSPTIAQVAMTTLKAGAWVPFSFESFEDIENLANDVGRLIQDAKNNYEGNRLTVGTGTGQPTGIVTAVTAVTASRVSTATGGTFVVGDVYKLHQSLDPRFRRNSVGRRMFMANVAIINLMRQFGTSNNYMAFLANMGQGQPPQVLGEDLEEASDMIGVVTTGNSFMIWGDFSRYIICDRIGMQTEFIPNLMNSSSLPTGQRGVLAHWRWNAGVSDVNAFRILKA